MDEDWAAVTLAIGDRMAELDRSQAEVIRRSELSKAIVGEIQHNTKQRRRSPRTLEALSQALDWHPGHRAAVPEGRIPPQSDAPFVRPSTDIAGRLDLVDHRLQQLAEDRAGLREMIEEAVRRAIRHNPKLGR